MGGAVSTLMSLLPAVVVHDMFGRVNEGQLNQISGYINALYLCGWTISGFTWASSVTILGGQDHWRWQ